MSTWAQYGTLTISSTGNIGINNTSPAFSIDITGTAKISNSITTSSLLATSNISTGALSSTTSTISNAFSINISSSSLNISTGITTSSLLNTGLISTANLTASTSTLPNAVFTNISSSAVIISTGITTGNILNTGLISTNSLTVTTSTLPNAVFTNISSSTVISTNISSTTSSIGTLLNTNNLIATGSINTIGSFIISGASACINGGINNNRCLVVGSATQGAISITNTGEARYHLYNMGTIREWLFGQKSNTNHNFAFTTLVSGVETDRMVVDINGNVGVGASPTSKLHIAGSSSATDIFISNTTAGSNSVQIGVANITSDYSLSAVSGDAVIRTSGHNLYLQATGNSIANLTITSRGNVGINVTSPGSTLDISGTLNVSTGITTSSLLNTGLISTGNLTASTSTLPNAVFTNISSSTVISTGITTSSLSTTGLISTANLFSTTSTLPNAVFTNISSSSLIINGGLDVVGGSIKIGSNKSIVAQGLHIQWNRLGAGESWLINQHGLGTGDIRFAISDTSNNITENMRLTDGGNLGIGDITPFTKLSTYQTISGAGMRLRTAQSTGAYHYTGCQFSVADTSVSTDNYVKGGIFFKDNGTGNARGDMYICVNNAINNTNVTPSDSALYINSSGLVGIGTTAPSSLLTVNGTFNATSSTIPNSSFTNISTSSLISTNLSSINSTITNMLFTNSTYTNLYTTNISTSTLLATSSLNANFNSNTLGNLFTTNGNIGIGTVSPISRLQVSSAGASTSIVISNVTSGSTKLEFCIANGATDYSTSARAGDAVIRTHTGANLIFQTSNGGNGHLTIVSTGSVGIGTTVPSSLLTVNGTFNATSSTIPNSSFTNISTSTLIATSILNANFNSNTLGNIYTTGGNIGVGTTAPITNVSIVSNGNPTGVLLATDAAQQNHLWFGVAKNASDFSGSARAGDSVILTNTGSNLILQTSNGGYGHLTIVSTGSVGIGTTAPSSLLTVNGTFNATSSTIPNTAFTNISTSTIIATSSLNANFNSNTIGNIYTTGGNIGIGFTAPNVALDINGGIKIANPNSIISQGLHLQWNRSAYIGEAWIINQPGTGTGDIRFGISNTSNSITEQMRLTNSGNLCIGNTNASSMLTLPTGSTSGGITWNSFGGPYSAIYDNANMHIWTDDSMYFDIGSIGTIGNATNVLQLSSSAVIVPTSASLCISCTSGAVGFNGALNINGNGGSQSISLVLNTSGNKGLQMCVAGGASNFSTSAVTGDAVIRTPTGANLIFQTSGPGAANIYLASSGNVGIGMTIPGVALQVAGQIAVTNGNIAAPTASIYGGSGSRYVLWNGTASTNSPHAIGVEAAHMWFTSAAGGYKWYNGASASPTAVMQLTTGNLIVTGDVTAFGSISDRNLKTNIQDISSETALEIINNIRPVTFNWKNDIFYKERQGQADSGFIAQEMQKSIPHAVGEYTEINSKKVYKNLRHERIIPYITGAIQELHKLLEEKNDQIKNLQNRISILENK